MAIGQTLYTTAALLGVMRDDEAMQPPSSYWLDLCFPGVITFEEEYIDFGKISDQRKIAPLVVPTAQGRPIYSAAERVSRVKPAYVKPKDPVSATRMIQRAAGLGELNVNSNWSPQQRYNAIVADILRTHRRAIERRWEWLAAQAVQFGTVTLEDEAYPRTVVDFERAAGHTVVLGSGSRWGDSGVSILGNIETWKKTVRDAPFGGPTNRLTVGSEAWEVMREDAEIREMLNLDLRSYNNGLNVNLGVRDGLDVERVGSVNGTTEIYVYSDYYHAPDGTVVPFMDPRDVVLTGPSVRGVRCFGAIQDFDANLQALAMFPKMWRSDDPSATFIMTQSAPLMVPVNPNNTFRARVVA
jgi:hypothetical protein